MDSLQKLRIPLILIFLVIVGGTLGYWLYYSVSLTDAFYMTAITISTVGFREVFPLDKWGKLFTSAIIFFGIGTITLTATYLFQFMVEGHLFGLVKRRKMDKKIASMRNHYIICGFGRVGEQVAGDFHAAGKSFVVMDHNPSVLPRLQEKGFLCVEETPRTMTTWCEPASKGPKGSLRQAIPTRTTCSSHSRPDC